MRRRSPAILEYDGAELIKALYDKASVVGEWTPEIADAVGLSTSYFSSIVSGERKVSSLNRDHLVNIQKYLGVPLIQVYVMADILNAEAFMRTDTIDDQMNLAYDLIKNDQEWSFLLPKKSTWDESSFAMKAIIALMYQKISSARIVEEIKLKQPKIEAGTD